MSHTEQLVKEAVETSLKELEKRYKELQEKMYKYSLFWIVGRFINDYILHRIGLHITTSTIVEGNMIDPTGNCAGSFWSFLHKPNGWDKVYQMLGDNYSKDIFDWFVKYRTTVGIANSAIANDLYPVKFLITLEEKSIIKKYILSNSFRVNGLKIKGVEEECLKGTFLFNAYSYKNIVDADLEDIVIDAGAYCGDTALYFSMKVGEKGKVYAFEPDNRNYTYLEKNIKLNNLKNIEPIKAGIGFKNTLAHEIGIGIKGSVTLRNGGDSNGELNNIKVYSIDNFILENQINRVDFIKMDIEGWEIDALKGAENCLKKYKPKLAICVYHKPEDLLNIATYLKMIVPNYNLYLDQKSIGWCETILYAAIPNNR